MNMHRTRSQTTEIDEILGEQQNVDNVSVDSQTQAQNDLKNAKKLFRVESSCSESSVSENEANIGIVMNKKKPPKESDIENIDMIMQEFSLSHEQLAQIAQKLGKGQVSNKEIVLAVNKLADTQAEIGKALSTIVDLFRPIAKYIPMMVERIEKQTTRKSRASHTMEEPWKHDYVLEFDGYERSIKNFANRHELLELIVDKQNNEWEPPKINDVSLKCEIQYALEPFFVQLDQPRKLGWAVAQYLFGAEYFTKKAIPMFKALKDNSKQREAVVSGRSMMNKYDFALLGSTLLYCGARLIAEFPKGRTKIDNARLSYMNACRDSINQQGYAYKNKESKEHITNHMAHIPNFIPVLARPEFIAAANEELYRMKEAKSKEKEAKRQKQQALSKMLQTTPLSTIKSNPFKTPFNTIGSSMLSKPPFKRGPSTEGDNEKENVPKKQRHNQNNNVETVKNASTSTSKLAYAVEDKEMAAVKKISRTNSLEEEEEY